ncbi:MAG: hypothetical protein BWY91_02368 [bacterium ADurb.BinA028]|nr:MAG: hypothetical protein BWY91_02368 [bacterium ADurb.BinA028]
MMPSSRGSVHTSFVTAMTSLRVIAGWKSGFWSLASEPPAPANLPYCDTHSTPPERNTSPSPALIAWKAIRVVCTDEAQNRLTVEAGRWSKPASTAMTRAMLAPCLPDGSAHPQ